ncbi:phosphotransferase family protein [Sphaerisporangium corydalis]|uniref:Phosphotransferase family protein n=1 Tax=Sphaerisporangium corydalis TaxID=1441875 RepID=A0ABV9EH25_9ACTN|nr:phosphotransferase family protein [Sphaerisporangium corydalis]
MGDAEELVAEVFGPGTAVEARVRLPGGASRETWSLDAVTPGGARRELVLRLDSPGAAPGAGAGLPREAALMRAARSTGVPVPEVVAEGTTGQGRAYILMDRIEGETIPRRILRRFPGLGPLLTDQCGRILAAVHRMPHDPLSPDGPGPGAGGPGGVRDPLEEWRELLDATGRPHPVFELALRRLAATRPAPGDVAVVHGDFRNGNLVVGPDGVRAVLDWELAHLGDPAEDLGWLCVKAWRFGSSLPVGGFGDYDRLLRAYEEAGGHPVGRAALRWWETFGVLKWGVICVMQSERHLGGGTRSVELAAIGRRVCENEWDLLGLLGLLDA